MQHRAHNRVALAVMLLAALCTYADAPRLGATCLIGNVVNYVAALEGTYAADIAALPASSLQARALAEKLDEGRQSRAIAANLPALPGVIAPQSVRPRVETQPQRTPRVDPPAMPGGCFALLPGAVLTVDLPPPPGTGQGLGAPPPTSIAAPCAVARGPPAA